MSRTGLVAARNHPFGYAAKHQMTNPPAPMGPNHDQIGWPLF